MNPSLDFLPVVQPHHPGGDPVAILHHQRIPVGIIPPGENRGALEALPLVVQPASARQRLVGEARAVAEAEPRGIQDAGEEPHGS